MNDVQLFNFNDTNVRIIMRDNEPWFVAADVCSVLDIRNHRDALSRLDEEDKGVGNTDTLGGPQSVTIINESGVFALTFTSRKAEARVFRRWVTSEVLPSIRKTGGYGVQPAPALSGPQLMAAALLEAQATLDRSKAQIEEMAPKAAYVDAYVADSDRVLIKEWGSKFDLRPSDTFDLLMERRVIHRKHLGSRWSNKQGRKVDEFEYRAYADWAEFFDLVPQHNAPRLHNGQVRQTLYVRQGRALDLARRLRIIPTVELVAS